MIPRISSSEFRSGFLGRNTPVIITDALPRWDNGGRWSPRFVADVLGHRQATVSLSEDSRFQYRPSRAADASGMRTFVNQVMAFGDAAHLMESEAGKRHMYIMQQSIPEKYPELMDKLVIPEWVRSEKLDINLWFGRDTITPLHFDNSNNLFAQTFGTKTFVIFAPSDTNFLYPYDFDAVMSHIAHVDALSPDLDRHPAFARAKPIRFEVGPGDLLFLPAYWWHQVQSTSLAISVNFWWAPHPSQMLSSPNSVRILYKMYREDRLTGLDTSWLAPAGLSLLTASKLLLSSGMSWAASILALAAFDRLVSSRFASALPGRSRGCAIGDLPAELKSVCASILAIAPFSPNDRKVIEGLPLMAQSATHYDDTYMDVGAIADLLQVIANMKSTGVR